MDILFLLGRLLYGGFFLMSGANHFIKFYNLRSYALTKKVPMPGVAVAISGLLILFGGLGILLGVYPEIALIMIILFLAPVSLVMHNFWSFKDPEMASQRMSDQTNFMKNMALLGAALMFLMIENWPLSLF